MMEFSVKKNRAEFLFIDCDAPSGHIGFNRIWLRSLCRTGNVSVTTVMPAVFFTGIMSHADFSGVENIAVPEWLCKPALTGLQWRLFSILRLLWIRFHVRMSAYDCVLFSSFDTLSFFCCSLFMRKRCGLVCHNNIKQTADHRIAAFCFRIVSKRHRIIVLEDYIKSFLEKRNIARNVVVIHHGCPTPFVEDSCRAVPLWFDELRKKYRKIIFSPSVTSTGTFWESFLNDPSSARILESGDVVFVVRTSADYPVRKGFFPVKERLSDTEYAAVFSASDAILIAYPPSFAYRTSAVLYEALANRKVLLICSNPAMDPYRPIVGEDVFFDDAASLWEIIGRMDDRTDGNRSIPEEIKVPEIYEKMMERQEK